VGEDAGRASVPPKTASPNDLPVFIFLVSMDYEYGLREETTISPILPSDGHWRGGKVGEK